ncbi:hypothetical protein [Prosthecomicrobium sp. N25]|uniref:hypothetical protein n=1 Tax=Prosthecomicrobium sp. N25 TaxID=3129254 RepID=UPI0030786AD1
MGAFSLSPLQRAALEAAARSPLKAFRRGYAADRFGPFHRMTTIASLEARGLVERRRTGSICRATPEGLARLAAARDLAPADA